MFRQLGYDKGIVFSKRKTRSFQLIPPCSLNSFKHFVIYFKQTTPGSYIPYNEVDEQEFMKYMDEIGVTIDK